MVWTMLPCGVRSASGVGGATEEHNKQIRSLSIIQYVYNYACRQDVVYNVIYYMLIDFLIKTITYNNLRRT